MVSVFRIVAMITLAAGTGMAGCRSSQSSENNDPPTARSVVPPDSVDPALALLDPEFTISSISEGRYALNFRAGAGGTGSSPSMAALHSLNSVSFQIYAPNGDQLASIATQDITTSGTANAETGSASLTAFGGVEWEPGTPLLPGTYAIAILRSNDGAFARRIDFPGAGSAMTPAQARASIDIAVETRSRGGGVEFLVTATRISPGPAEEYLPSGEKYRIEIRDDVGETIWSSSTGKVFTQALVPMDPGPVGDDVTYREFWDGRNELTRLPVPPGRYRLVITIPAHPTPYISRQEFTWSGR